MTLLEMLSARMNTTPDKIDRNILMFIERIESKQPSLLKSEYALREICDRIISSMQPETYTNAQRQQIVITPLTTFDKESGVLTVNKKDLFARDRNAEMHFYCGNGCLYTTDARIYPIDTSVRGQVIRSCDRTAITFDETSGKGRKEVVHNSDSLVPYKDAFGYYESLNADTRAISILFDLEGVELEHRDLKYENSIHYTIREENAVNVSNYISQDNTLGEVPPVLFLLKRTNSNLQVSKIKKVENWQRDGQFIERAESSYDDKGQATSRTTLYRNSDPLITHYTTGPLDDSACMDDKTLAEYHNGRLTGGEVIQILNAQYEEARQAKTAVIS